MPNSDNPPTEETAEYSYRPLPSMSPEERESFDFEAQDLDSLSGEDGVITYLGREWHLREPQSTDETMEIFEASADADVDYSVLVGRLLGICVTDAERTRPNFHEMTPFQVATLGAAVADWLDLPGLVVELGSMPAVRRRLTELSDSRDM